MYFFVELKINSDIIVLTIHQKHYYLKGCSHMILPLLAISAVLLPVALLIYGIFFNIIKKIINIIP